MGNFDIKKYLSENIIGFSSISKKSKLNEANVDDDDYLDFFEEYPEILRVMKYFVRTNPHNRESALKRFTAYKDSVSNDRPREADFGGTEAIRNGKKVYKYNWHNIQDGFKELFDILYTKTGANNEEKSFIQQKLEKANIELPDDDDKKGLKELLSKIPHIFLLAWEKSDKGIQGFDIATQKKLIAIEKRNRNRDAFIQKLKSFGWTMKKPAKTADEFVNRLKRIDDDTLENWNKVWGAPAAVSIANQLQLVNNELNGRKTPPTKKAKTKKT
jgi:hypothetical protein